ncbi:hypothetical protein C8Q78DRAFT_366095 [Trametes maxima]|nr:hypothetical protein C8Q78DRAFT_366095 [Trametes maxima]
MASLIEMVMRRISGEINHMSGNENNSRHFSDDRSQRERLPLARAGVVRGCGGALSTIDVGGYLRVSDGSRPRGIPRIGRRLKLWKSLQTPFTAIVSAFLSRFGMLYVPRPHVRLIQVRPCITTGTGTINFMSGRWRLADSWPTSNSVQSLCRIVVRLHLSPRNGIYTARRRIRPLPPCLVSHYFSQPGCRFQSLSGPQATATDTHYRTPSPVRSLC